MIGTKRVYDSASPDDGERVLVMRLWPRGVRKEAVDRWEKELGPSTELLRAYRAGRIDWEEFARRYRAEMGGRRELLAELSTWSRQGTVTLLCGCEEESRCHRTVLRELVEAVTG